MARRSRSRDKNRKGLPASLKYTDSSRVFPSLDANMEKIKTVLGDSADLIIRRVEVAKDPKHAVVLVYLKGLVQQDRVDGIITKSLMIDSAQMEIESNLYDFVKEHALSATQVEVVSSWKALFEALLDGKTILMGEDWPDVMCVNTVGGERRSVTSPNTQTVVRGPRDSFTETLLTNISLIRRRIKSPKLWVQMVQVGAISRTDVAVMYVEGIANPEIVKEVIQKISQVEIDGVLESGMLESFLEDKTFTPFPTLYNTERPDAVSGGLLEGRIAILVDNTPVVLVVPATFFQFLTTPEEYGQRWGIATFIRLLRYVIFFVSLLMPSMYIALTTHHQEMIPTQFLISLMAQREGVPFPAIAEAILMELLFEILREAGIRAPAPLSAAVTIVGAIIIGDTAIQAGIVSPAMVLVVAVTAIASFATPNYTLAISARLIRFGLMITAGLFGLFGLTLALIVIVAHMNSLRSFGTPYLQPVAPLVLRDFKDLMVRFPTWALYHRPRGSRPLDDKRTPKGQKPKPTQDPEEEKNR